MASAPPVAFHNAFQRLKDSVTIDDARTFQNTRLEDVWSAARAIERDLESRGDLIGFRRVEPLLSGLEQWSKVIEIACNGTPYLPWIWAPIKMMLQIAQGHRSALEKLISAYASIADVMPRFDKLSVAFRSDPNFQQLMGLFYSDILEFHRRAYKYFCRRAWKTMFDSLWTTFGSRFQAILDSISRHRDLIDQEANATNIAEAQKFRLAQLEEFQKWRSERIAEARRQEIDRGKSDVREAVAWLDSSCSQEDILDSLRRHGESTCDYWVIHDKHFQAWYQISQNDNVLWLNGKPGIGKSVLCAQIVKHIRDDRRQIVFHYFCNKDASIRKPLNEILRCIISQSIVFNPDLATHLLDTLANRGQVASNRNLKAFFEKAILSLPAAYFVLDGIDELSTEDQQEILEVLLKLCSSNSVPVKLLLSSRRLARLSQALRSRPVLNLDQCSKHIHKDIERYTTSRLKTIAGRFGAALAAKLEQEILSKSNSGLITARKLLYDLTLKDMFLWVRLVLSALELLHSEAEVEEAVYTMPEGLEAIYAKILNLICGNGRAAHQRKVIRILQWLLAANRRLRKPELECGIVLDGKVSEINGKTKYSKDVLELCSPLLEIDDDPSGAVGLVHFTAREYLVGHSNNHFFSLYEAHLAVSVSCALYLKSGLELLESQSTTQRSRDRVLEGYHDLCPYATEHWHMHLQMLSELSEPTSISESGLQTLRKALDDLTSQYKYAYLNGGLNLTADSSKAMVGRFQDCLRLNHDTSGLISLAMTAASKAGRSLNIENGPDSNVESTVPFTAVKLRYQAIVEILLVDDQITEVLSPMRLQEFRAKQGKGAWVCRYSACTQAILGFESKELRDSHETAHAVALQCREQDCARGGIPFKSRAHLQRHLKSAHTQESLWILPKARGALDFAQAHSGFKRSNSQLRVDISPSRPESRVHLKDSWVAKAHAPFMTTLNGKEGPSALWRACYFEDNDEVALQLRSNPEDLGVADGDGITTLQIAAWAGNVHIVKALLNAGHTVDSMNRFQQTALSIALHGRQHFALASSEKSDSTEKVLHRYKTIIEMLLIAGANPEHVAGGDGDSFDYLEPEFHGTDDLEICKLLADARALRRSKSLRSTSIQDATGDMLNHSHKTKVSKNTYLPHPLRLYPMNPEGEQPEHI